MPQVVVTISGKSYRMACAEGEEAHLANLAALYDGKIAELRTSFGEIGEMRLHVMASLTIADDLSEARRHIAGLEAEIAEKRELASLDDERGQILEARVTAGLLRAAERIERLAKELSASP